MEPLRKFLCDQEKARLIELKVKVRPHDDYVDTRFIFTFVDGSNIDRRICDLDFIPDELIEGVADWMEFIEAYKEGTRLVYEVTMNEFGDDGSFILTNKARVKGGNWGFFKSRSSALPDNIRSIILAICNYAKESYGKRPMELGVLIADVPPPLELSGE